MASGLMTFMGIGVESSGAGSAATGAHSATVIDFIPITGENLTLQRADLPDPSLWVNYFERKMYNGLQRVEGGVQFVAHPILTGYFLRACTDTTTAVGSSTLVASDATCREHRFIGLGTGQFQSGSGSDLPTLTIEMNRGPIMGSGSSFLYYNCAGNVLELTCEAGQFTRGSVEFIGRDYGGKTRSTPSFIPPDAFLWHTASVSLNGAAKPHFESLTFRLENNLEAIPTLDGRLRPDLVKRNDFARVSVNGNISFRSFDDYNDFVNGSETVLKATFLGKAIRTSPSVINETMEWEVPGFRYSTFPLNASGPQHITIGFTGRGMISPTSNYAYRISLVNSRTSGFHVNTTA
jgi:hypothetical protein